MQLKKFLLFGLLTAIMPAVAEEAADRKTATSLKYVEHELSTRQNKFDAEQNKAMEYTNAAGTVQKRAVTSDLDNGGTDSLPMVGGVNTKLNQKQDDIDPFNDHTAVTYTGQPGGIGKKGIYQATESYAEQRNDLIDAKTFNAAIKNGLDSEFICSEFKPGTNLCWVYSIHNNGMPKQYVSATGTGVQDGAPTPTNPIYPVFYRQGDMVLRRVGNYADSYDATTHKITRNVGVKVFDGTETGWVRGANSIYIDGLSNDAIGFSANNPAIICSHFQGFPPSTTVSTMPDLSAKLGASNQPRRIYFVYDAMTTTAQFQQYLADQYNAGTPVTVYYPLATPVEEDWTETTYNENVYIPQNQ